MRLTSGAASGAKIYSPKGLSTRPALARVRNSLFNILAAKLQDKNVLDLFAGTGSIGLEAISMGAGFTVFVDNDPRCLEIIARNCEKLKVTGKVRMIRNDVFKILNFLVKLEIKYDIVFIDPPYDLYDFDNMRLVKLVSVLAESEVTNPGALFILEHRVKNGLNSTPQNVKLTDYRKYGQTALSFYQKLGDIKNG